MPEILDQDDSYYYVQPDDGGMPIPIAKGSGAIEALGIPVPGGTTPAPPMGGGQPPVDVPAADPVGAQVQGEFSGELPPITIDTGHKMPIEGLPPLTVGTPDPSAGGPIQGVAGSGPVNNAPMVFNDPSKGELGKKFKSKQEADRELAVLGADEAGMLTKPQSIINPGPLPQTPEQGAAAKTASSSTAGGGTGGGGPNNNQKQYLDAMEAERKAKQRQQEIAEQAAKEVAFAATVEANAAEEYAKQKLERDQGQQAAMNGEMGKLATLQKDHSNSKLDPDRIWKTKGVGARIVAEIGKALGAFGAALTGGPNYAAEEIDKLVRMDIEAQRDEIQRKGEAVSEQRNTIALMKSNNLDTNQAAAAAHILGLESARSKLRATIAADAPEEVKARAAELDAQMGQKIAAVQEQFRQASIPRSIDIEKRLRLEKLRKELNKEDAARLVTLPDGSTSFARTPKEAEHINDAEEVRVRMHAKLDRVKDIVKNNLGHTVAGTARAELDGLLGDLQTDFGKAKGMGAMSETEYAKAMQFADPTKFTTKDSTVTGSIDAYKQRIDTGHMLMLKARKVLGGAQPAQPQAEAQ